MQIAKYDYGTGMKVCEKAVTENSVCSKSIAFISRTCGVITWYTNAAKVPDECKKEIQNISDQFKDDFYKLIDSMEESKALFYLLDYLTTDESGYIINELKGNYPAKIDYALDLIEGKKQFKHM